jgi:hypothetical protein
MMTYKTNQKGVNFSKHFEKLDSNYNSEINHRDRSNSKKRGFVVNTLKEKPQHELKANEGIINLN